MISKNTRTVSIIIPTYNRAHLLRRAIQSALVQTYRHFELIVVDDASTDNTEEIIKKLNDPRIRYIRHKTNKGGSAARNTGIKNAQGEFIAFQDSDDEWLLEKLEKQMRVFQSCSDNMGVVYCGFLRWDGRSAVYVPSPKIKVRDGDISSQILCKNFVGTPTLLIRRECFEKIGLFDEQLPRFQDWELVIRLAGKYHFYLIDEPLVMAYVTLEGITNNGAAGTRAREIILERHYKTLSKTPQALADHLYNLGHLKCLNETMAYGRSYFVKSVRVSPGYIKAWTALVLSLFGSKAYKTARRIRQLLWRITKK
ncbi:MAG: glycosyltransferase [Thermodesulfobacteriota bacterium]|nr:glycosyltransferase [Thermodesulfobacteriota bacterium]